jgi:thiamine thiazole synthase
MKFAQAKEKDVTRSILDGFVTNMKDIIDGEVLIIGSGPAGLMAARTLGLAGVKPFIIEQNNYLGGGMWLGGYFMNKVTFRSPSEEILENLEVPYERYSDGLVVTDGPHVNSKLISKACEAGVRFQQLTYIDDVILRDSIVSGAVINWSPVRALPRQITCVDPVAVESKIVIDATGHDAVVARMLDKKDLIEVKGLGSMDVEGSEDAVVEHTQEIYPGLIITGMAVAEVCGLPRMGPTFGSMIYSGKRAGEIALKKLANMKAKTHERKAS